MNLIHLSELSKFTDTEKTNVLPVLYRLVDLGKEARTNGILFLEKEMADEPNLFLRTGITLIVDGTVSEAVEDIMDKLICSGNFAGEALLSRLLIMEGVLLIQEGINPRILLTRLAAMLGEEYLALVENGFDKATEDRAQFIRCFFQQINDQKAVKESECFEKVIGAMDFRSIQYLIRHISFDSLMMALAGCSAFVIKKVFENLSFRWQEEMAKMWQFDISKKAMIYSQQEILKTASELAEEGMILPLF